MVEAEVPDGAIYYLEIGSMNCGRTASSEVAGKDGDGAAWLAEGGSGNLDVERAA